MKTPSLPLVLTLWALFLAPLLRAAEPLVSNVRAAQNGSTREVLINYDLSLSGAASTYVSLQVSSNGGGTWLVPANTLSGNGIGSGVTPGKGKLIVWNAMTDWPGQLSPQTRFKVTASDYAPPGNMVPIPGGTFQMGNSFAGEGYSDEVPVHSVTVSAFYLQNTEVTKAQWDAVRDWGAAAGRGYTDLPVGGGKAANHPVHSITWY
ncbi:MAG: SUMF1/EgtB/PvdO family nonheme iron enzyme, partial [Akkermansiaceae bacterium]|nr:SUMF1/EgtB/PvdO family nonheme iron enzyme [Akkermansiaceae bacterium]